jgi:hypothetical protein
MILDKITNFFRRPDLFVECRKITRKNKKKNAIRFYEHLCYDVRLKSGKGRSKTIDFIEYGKDYSLIALRFFRLKHRGFDVKIKDVKIKDINSFYSYEITW